MRAYRLRGILSLVLGALILAVLPRFASGAGGEQDLASADRKCLLDLARATIRLCIEKNEFAQPDEKNLGEAVRGARGCFVTFWRKNNSVEGSAGVFGNGRPLYENVIRCTAASGWDGLEREWRFLTSGSETLVGDLFIEISLVTAPTDLSFTSAEDLLARLRPSVDGVVLYTRHGSHLALPSTWRQFPEKEEFLANLCRGHGAPEDAWKKDFKNIRVQTFQAVSFSEKELGLDGNRNAGASLGAAGRKKIEAILGQRSVSAEAAPVGSSVALGASKSTVKARVRNRGDLLIESLRLGPAGSAGLPSLAAGEHSGYAAFPITTATAGGEPVAVGTYRRLGDAREIFVPSLPEKATIVLRDNGYTVERPDQQLPLWPYPHEVALGDGACDLKGKAIFVPAEPDAKTMAIAEALASHLARYLKLASAPEIRKGGAPPSKGQRVISIGAGPEAWAKTGEKSLFENVRPTIRGQAFYLEIAPEGAVLVSPGAPGLSYAALALMQLARCGAKDAAIPCATIVDWPDMEFRAALGSSAGYPLEHRRHAARLCWEGRIPMLCWGMRPSYFLETHPEWEWGPPKDKEEFLKLVNEVRSWGVEVPVGHDFGIDGWRGSMPYAFMNDNETYFWAMKEIVDEKLEAVPTRYFKLGMDEEYFVRPILYGPRPLEQFRHVAATIMAHLRRRGVTGTIWTDVLYPGHGGNPSQYGPAAEKFRANYESLMAGFPNDLILVPWFYWVKKPEDAINGCDMINQARSGLPVLPCAMGPNTEHHVAAVLQLRDKYPNLLGVMGAAFGGRPLIRNRHPRHPYYVETSIGPLWNLGSPPDYRDGFAWETEPGVSNWECLLDEDPPQSIPEALGRLADPSWRVWLHAREQLVAAGLSAAPALLAAMSEAEGTNRDRIEGCLSRNARALRQGRKRGTLDVAKTLPFLRDRNEAVRDIAAELIASCAEKGAAILRENVRDPVAGVACIRALGIVKDASSAKDLAETLADTNSPARSRAEAARVLGVLRAGGAASALRQALTSSGEKEVQKAALWALALTGRQEAAGEIAACLESKDDDLRFRAAVALVILKSPETKRLASWLSRDRTSLEVAAWAMWKTWTDKEAGAAVREAMKTQANDTNRRRLEQLVGVFDKTADRSVSY